VVPFVPTLRQRLGLPASFFWTMATSTVRDSRSLMALFEALRKLPCPVYLGFP
jgi:hypothetical protein